MNHPLSRILGIVLLLATGSVATAQQTHEISKGFVVLNEQLGSNVFYDTDFPTTNPDFTNEVAHIMENGSLLIGGEVQSSRGSVDAQETAADEATLFYSLNGGAFSSLDLPLISSGAPDVWQQQAFTGMVEIGRGLPIGVHTVSVYFVATDNNFPLGGPIAKRLPETGTYDATVRVSPGPLDLVACDTAAEAAYGAGWADGANGGFGFQPWVMLADTVGDGDSAGFFTASNPANSEVNYILTQQKAWGTYANEGSTGGDDIQIAGAFRSLNQPLEVGQTLSIDIEHSGIQGGSLTANNPPRTGGWVGFALRVYPPTLQGDPDPFNPFGTMQNAVFAFGFRGGNGFYQVYDVTQPSSGRSTGIPYTTNGVQVRFTLTATNAYEVVLTSKGPGSQTTNITGSLSLPTGGAITNIALYNRNAEEGDVFFNNLCVFDPPASEQIAYDDAADAAYSGGWADAQDGGSGFEPWSISVTEDGGAAGTFTAAQPGNTDLNHIATGGKAWGLYANDNGVGGVQFVTATRSFTGGELENNQTFSLRVEHGDISSVNGELKIVLVGTPTFGNVYGEVLTYKLSGGSSEYTVFDNSYGSHSTGIPASHDGFQLDFTLTSDTAPYTYVMKIEQFGSRAGVHYFNGTVQSIPKTVKIVGRDIELADVFLNQLEITGLRELLITGIRITTTAEITVDSLAGWSYSLVHSDGIATQDWQLVTGQTDIPGTGAPLVLSHSSAGYYRVQAESSTP